MKRAAARRIVPALIGAGVAVFAAFAACSTQQIINTGGDFSAPTGIATVAAADRDFLIIANSGSSELRALNLCNTPADAGPLADGGRANTCPTEQDFKFVPGPIRLFPASFPIANRPLRLAGVNLDDGQGQRGGAILVAGAPTTPSPGLDGGISAVADGGADNAIFVVDSNDILAVERGVAKTMPAPVRIAIDTPAVDVIAATTSGAEKLAFAVTLGAGAVKPQIVALSARLEGSAAKVALKARCTLDIVGAKLALVPGLATKLYVADATPNGVAGGIGDGAVELDVAQLLALGNTTPPAACPAGRRIAATDTYANPPRARPLTSLALNPEVLRDEHSSVPLDPQGVPIPGAAPTCSDGSTTSAVHDLCPPIVDYAAGELILGVTGSSDRPLDPTDPTSGKEAGRLVFLRTAAGGLAPIPPFNFHDTGRPPMKSLAVNGLAREVAFLTPPPREKCPDKFPDRPCGLIFLVKGGSRPFGLAAVATSTDGASYFIEASARRFFNDARDYAVGTQTLGPVPNIDTAPFQSPTAPLGTTDPPVLVFATGDLDPTVKDSAGNPVPLAGGRGDGLLTAGVSRKSRWQVTYHAPIPGLERRTGRISRTTTAGGGVGFHLDLPGAQLDKLQALSAACGVSGRFCLGLGVGDFASFLAFNPLPGDTLCPELLEENARPPRELRIDAIGAASLELGAEPNPLSTGAFADLPASCFPAGSGVAVTLEARTGEGLGNRPWLVLQGTEPRGRTAFGEQFFGYEPRFDYPLDLPAGAADATPAFTQDVGVSFTVRGSAPIAKTSIFFGIASGQGQTSTRDPSSVFAGPLTVYSSAKVTNLVFTSVTGANEVLQTDPSLIGTINGTIAYR